MDLSRSQFQDTQPRVSPDGKQVAFVSDRTGQDAVYVVGVDGRGLERVSGELVQPILVGWSRAGDLAIESWRPAPSSVGLLDVFAPGLHEHWRVRQPDGMVGAEWSPDGRLIAFGTPGGVRIVSNTGGSVFQVQGRGLDFSWSPAGRLTVVSADVVRVFRADGRLLARFRGTGAGWSPSGDRLATMAGGVLEVRGRGGTGGLLLQKRLFAESEIRQIKENLGGYLPALLWVTSNRVAIGNVDPVEQASTWEPFPGEPVET